jgi:DNA-directed RNA polymerase delta subunit
MAKKIIDTAFELADAKFKKNNFSFKELFDLIKNEPNANVDNEAFVANFYTQLLSSPDFLMIDNQR